jgi:hypothetical protein
MKQTRAESLQQKEGKNTADLLLRLTEALLRHKLICDFLTQGESMTLADYNRLSASAATLAKKSLPRPFKSGK